MPMISYAQNAEDVLLRRVFGEQKEGFYIDVGAYDPVSCSLTKHFYDRGWRGLNVEASPTAHRRVSEGRPRDICINVGVSSEEGTLPFYEFPVEHGGLSTFSEEEAKNHARDGYTYRVFPVPVTTLAKLCETHVKGPIDFLSIDVEGHEREVLAGADFRRFRPRIILVEATRPRTTTTSHDRWESILLGADYLYATFDGLNRYYVRAETPEDAEPLRVPPNTFDDYIPYIHWQEIERLREEVRRLKEERTFLSQIIARAERMTRRALKKTAGRLLGWS
ncbi:MAG: FkbM family methyltransferase [Myxococcales bacterium]|nr:FkbM family methyltransferase [Polyangiaceae bacterium]MDW8250763.1 FkbM family methyltransferase [Myxococcales bacterium]